MIFSFHCSADSSALGSHEPGSEQMAFAKELVCPGGVFGRERRIQAKPVIQ